MAVGSKDAGAPSKDLGGGGAPAGSAGFECDDCGAVVMVVMRTDYAKFCRRCAFIPPPKPRKVKK